MPLPFTSIWLTSMCNNQTGGTNKQSLLIYYISSILYSANLLVNENIPYYYAITNEISYPILFL